MKALCNTSLAAALVIAAAGVSNAADGVITGKVMFKGTAPGEKSIDMAADANCKALHAAAPTTRHYVVNADGTLANVFVYVKSGPGVDGKKFDPPKEKVTLDQKGCLYQPYLMGIQVNQDLEVLNSDATLHNVHATPSINAEFNKGQPVQGMKFTHKFDKVETVPPVRFKCDVHPWMFAYVAVVPHPYFAVTREDGSYKISGVPAGDYVVEAFHLKAGGGGATAVGDNKGFVQSQKVTVGAGEAKADFTFEPPK